MVTQHNKGRVTSAELVRQFGCWQERAITEAIHITHHGRDRLVMMSARNYGDLLARLDDTHDSAAIDDLATVLHHLAQGCLFCDDQFVVREINPAGCGHLHMTRSALVGRNILEVVPALHGTLFHAHMTRALNVGEAASFDMPSAAVPGRWLHVQTFPISEGAVMLFRDITEQLSASAVADGRAAIIAALGALGRVGTALLSARGAFLDVDATLAGMAGFAPDVLRHVRMTDVLALDRRVAAGRVLESVLTGAAPVAFDSAFLIDGATPRPVRVALAALAGEHAPDGAVMVVTET